MKIKRFIAKDIRQVMRMVKDELGADAVIMSNRTVDEGIEIVAAKDFDEQAIHNKLNSSSGTPNEKPQKENKNIALTDFEAERNKLHIVSSARKIGDDAIDSTQKRNKRGQIDQYLGYSEKLNFKSENKKKNINADKRIVKPLKSARATQQFSNVVRKEIKQQSDNVASAQFMQEMRDEIKGLKSVLDSKLSEISWSQNKQDNPVRNELLHRLSEMGFSKKLSMKVASRLDSHQDAAFAVEKAKEMLAKVLPVSDDNLLDEGGIVALVGPTGVGKTTTIAKLAAQFILKHGSKEVVLITTDNYRIGAHEQLATYGRLLDVPVCIAANADELRTHINSFNHKKLILIDTAGMSQRDMRLAEQIQTLQQEDVPIKTYLVMSAATQYKAMNEIINAFKVFEPESSILTKLDETVVQGSALSASIEQQLPISFMTNGQQVPEDIYFPDATALIEQCDIEEEKSTTLSHNDWMAEGYA